MNPTIASTCAGHRRAGAVGELLRLRRRVVVPVLEFDARRAGTTTGRAPLVWSVTTSIGHAAAQQLGQDRRRSCRPGRPTAPAVRLGGQALARPRRRGRRRPRRGSGARPAAAAGPGRRRRSGTTPPFIVTASGCAPPMPPQPPVSGQRPGERAAEALGRPRPRTSRRCPAGCPACRCRSTSRRSSARTSSGRAASRRAELRPGRPVAAPGWRWRCSTRGAHSCVRSTPTGRPDCTSSVSSSRKVPQRAHDRVEAGPVPRRAPGAAVDDEVVGTLGHLRVEVVHQHPQRGLGRPRPGASGWCRAGRGRGGLRSRGRLLLDGRGRWSSQGPDDPGRGGQRGRRRRTWATAASISGDRNRSGPGPATVAAARPTTARGRGARRRAAPADPAPRAAVSSSIASTRRQRVDGAPQLAGRRPAHRHVVLLHGADDGMESTLAGTASRLSSLTSAACVYCAIMSPESTPGSSARNGGRPCAAAGVEQPVGAPLGHRRQVGAAIARKSST